MKQYLELLNKIITEGVEKESGRDNMPKVIGISNAVMKFDLSEGFPLLTTKKMFFKGIITELLWMLRGDTNIKYLVDNGVNIWSGDAYRWYTTHIKEKYPEMYLKMPIEKFLDYVKNEVGFGIKEPIIDYKFGDLGKVYGHQWRNQNGVDQVRDVIEGLKNNPYSRYHIIDSWNAQDFKEMALPPCHLMYHFIVRPLTTSERLEFYEPERLTFDESEERHKYLDALNVPKFYLDLNMYQRSCDFALGIPYNLASMSLLLMIFSKTSNMIPGIATWIGGDVHIYLNHIEQLKEQQKRKPYNLSNMNIKKDIHNLDDILSLSINDFELTNYKSHDKIDYELFVGLKK